MRTSDLNFADGDYFFEYFAGTNSREFREYDILIFTDLTVDFFI